MAKETQALFVALTHNLLLAYEQELEQGHGVRNEAEDKRRQKRREGSGKVEGGPKRAIPALVLQALYATQRSLKFVRWVRLSIRDRVAEAHAVLRLRAL